MTPTASPLPLQGWHILCLRPSGQQAGARRCITALGGRHVALPGLRLAALEAPEELEAALHRSSVIFTSPAAVRFAAKTGKLHLPATSRAVAVGSGTARALAREGIVALAPPAHAMHSEGLLALAHWDQAPTDVGLITAPGGRGLIAQQLVARGFDLLRVHVYQRQLPRLDSRHYRALQAAEPPRAALVSSAEAVQNLLRILPPALAEQLRGSLAVVSSARLDHLLAELGFSSRLNAMAPGTREMLDCLSRHVATTRFR